MIKYQSKIKSKSLFDFFSDEEAEGFKDTKKMSFIKEIKNITKLSRLQAVVLECLKNNGACCDFEISEHTGLAINVVTPRRGELAKKGLIRITRQDNSPISGKLVTFWGVL